MTILISYYSIVFIIDDDNNVVSNIFFISRKQIAYTNYIYNLYVKSFQKKKLRGVSDFRTHPPKLTKKLKN